MISEALNHDFLLEYTHDAIPDNSFVVLHIHAVNGKYFVKQVENNIEWEVWDENTVISCPKENLHSNTKKMSINRVLNLWKDKVCIITS